MGKERTRISGLRRIDSMTDVAGPGTSHNNACKAGSSNSKWKPFERRGVLISLSTVRGVSPSSSSSRGGVSLMREMFSNCNLSRRGDWIDPLAQPISLKLSSVSCLLPAISRKHGRTLLIVRAHNSSMLMTESLSAILQSDIRTLSKLGKSVPVRLRTPTQK